MEKTMRACKTSMLIANEFNFNPESTEKTVSKPSTSFLIENVAPSKVKIAVIHVVITTAK